MPKPYEIIQNYYPSPQFDTKMKEALKMLGPSADNLPGVKIMKTVGPPAGFKQLFDAFAAYIHQPASNFTWNGSAPGGSAYKLLDGDTNSTECATYANAFMMLCWAPKPYGLGLSKAEFSLTSYSGESKKGFVSNHPTVGVIRLLPNVAGQALYFWANHKVIAYQGRFHDVMYKTSYANKEDMAVYQVMENEAEMGDATFYPCEPVGPVVQGKGKQGCWFKESPQGKYAGPSLTMPF